MSVHVYVFLLVVCLSLSLALLWRVCWFPLRPSHPRDGATHTTAQRLLKPCTPLDCPDCRLSCDHSSVVKPAPTPVLKTASHQIAMVLSALAEGLNPSEAPRVFGYRQATITSLSHSRWATCTDLPPTLLLQSPASPAGSAVSLTSPDEDTSRRARMEPHSGERRSVWTASSQ